MLSKTMREAYGESMTEDQFLRIKKRWEDDQQLDFVDLALMFDEIERLRSLVKDLNHGGDND